MKKPTPIGVPLRVIHVPTTIPRIAVIAANTIAPIAALTAASLEAYPMAPPWVAPLLAAGASTAAYLAGGASPSLQVPGGPVVPLCAVPVLLVLASVATIAATHVGGWQGGVLVVASTILAGLAGKVGPQQTIPTAADKT